jgi:hypothetical protein
VPKPLRVTLIVLLLAAPALWWVLRTDPESPAPLAAPVKPAPRAPQLTERPPQAEAQVPEKTDEQAPLQEPVEDGPGPCIALEVLANGAPAAGARVVVTYTPAGTSNFEESQWRLGTSGRARSWCNPGEYSLGVEVPGLAPALALVEVPSGGKDVPLRLELQPGHTLRGYVFNEVTRQPIAGVRLKPIMHERVGPRLEFAEVTTDAQGAFAVSHLAEGSYTLDLKAPGYKGTFESSVQVPRQEPLSLSLAPKCRLEGQVVDGATGVPVSGARVWVSPFGSVEGDALEHTDGQGHFSLEVDEGEHHLVAQLEDQVGVYPDEVPVELGGRVEGLVIRLGPTGVVSGRVLSLSDRQPLKNADLQLVHVDSGWDSTADTDANGDFRVEHLPTGKYEVSASAKGFGDQTRKGLRLEAGRELTLEFALTREASLEGTVVDALGRPASKVLVVAALKSEAAEPEQQSSQTSDATGHYEIRGLAAGRYQLQVMNLRGGKLIDLQEITLAEGQTARADLTLPDATGHLEGTVRRVSGGPPLHAVEVLSSSGSLVPEHAVDKTGRFSVPLSPGTYTIAASYAEVPDTELTYKRVTIEAGKTKTVELTVPDHLVETTGIVLDSHGVPVRDIEVTLSNDELDFSGLAREDGHFTVKSPEKSTGTPMTLTAELGPEHVTLPGVRLGSRNVVVRLQAPASLRGRVIARAGAPVKGFVLSVNQGPDALTVLDGRPFGGDTFTLEGMPADSLELLVRTTDGRSGKARVRPEPGGTSQVEIQVGGLARVVGRLVDAAGEPYEGWAAVDAGGAQERSGDSGANGRFEIYAIEPGTHRLEFTLPDGMEEDTREFSITLRAGETLDVGDLGPNTRSAMSSP